MKNSHLRKQALLESDFSQPLKELCNSFDIQLVGGNIAKSINKLVGDFQQGGYLYKPASAVAFTGHPSTHGDLIGFRNKPEKK